MINALRYTEELEKVGFTSEQAKKSVDTWMTLMDQNFATKSDFREFQLVNKADLGELRVDLEGQIRELREDMQGQIRELRVDMDKIRVDLENQIRELKHELKTDILNLEKKVDGLALKLAVSLGSVMAVGMTLGFAFLSLKMG